MFRVITVKSNFSFVYFSIGHHHTRVDVNINDAETVIKARMKLNLSQRGPASTLGVSPRTVEAWEAGRNTPCGAARNLLYLLKKDNSLIAHLIMK